MTACTSFNASGGSVGITSSLRPMHVVLHPATRSTSSSPFNRAGRGRAAQPRLGPAVKASQGTSHLCCPPALATGSASSPRLSHVSSRLLQYGSWCNNPPHERHVGTLQAPLSRSTRQSDPITSQ
ncbi:hypothetical protein NDU88_000601 [Pleurodeles waltl]|uniref:Uncharacterized protein n=1 Tax=Pleurodeles waltl TaxID=8319 RepID=A0AAV7V8G7_PLEWA|nr:hypothetical protein NDU88_000601 [Pleurodeles waltl]